MRFDSGTVILYSSPWEKETHVGMVTKKSSAGCWVLWCDGTHKILQKQLLKYARSI